MCGTLVLRMLLFAYRVVSAITSSNNIHCVNLFAVLQVFLGLAVCITLQEILL